MAQHLLQIGLNIFVHTCSFMLMLFTCYVLKISYASYDRNTRPKHGWDYPHVEETDSKNEYFRSSDYFKYQNYEKA